MNISPELDREGKGERQIWISTGGTDEAWIQTPGGKKACSLGHTHPLATLKRHLQTRRTGDHICPTCASSKNSAAAAASAAASAATETVDAPEDIIPAFFRSSNNLWEIIESRPLTLSSLRDVLVQASLSDALRGEGPLTLFAPDNNAFKALSVSPSADDLLTILKHHVVAGRVEIATIAFGGSTTVTTLAGTQLKVSRSFWGAVYVDGVPVIMPELRASNGIMHVISEVLIPTTALPAATSALLSSKAMSKTGEAHIMTRAAEFLGSDSPNVGDGAWNLTVFDAIAATPRLSSLTNALFENNLDGTLSGAGPFTVFAPRDSAFALLGATPEPPALLKILLHHVVPSDVMSSDIPTEGASYPTLAQDNIRLQRTAGGAILVDGVASVTLGDFVTDNGIVHVIDRVLVPSSSSSSSTSAASAKMAAPTAHFGSHLSGDDSLFDAFSLEPDPFTTHRSESAAPHVELVKFEERMTWNARRNGWVLPFERQSTAFGVPIDDLIKEARWTNKVEIAYTVMMPKEWDQAAPGANDDKTVIVMLHGVPANRKWKYHMMEIMARRGAIVVAPDLLGMGDSTHPLNFGHLNEDDKDGSAVPDNTAWDWKHDVGWIHALIKYRISEMARLGFSKRVRAVVAADDWGAGPAQWLLAERPKDISHLVLINPIHLDGYFVIEIGTIGRLNDVRLKAGNAEFQRAAFGLPQSMVGIEKYMVEERFRMNRYTESTYLGPYQDTRYQSGQTAADMKPNYWSLAVLAARSARLAPRQLLPFHPVKNKSGLRFDQMPADVPVDFIWGRKDQMMPPVQVFRSVYLFPGPVRATFIDGANHFTEIDQPYRVADALTLAILGNNKEALPVFLGDSPEFVYKGDEKEMRKKLATIYKNAPSCG